MSVRIQRKRKRKPYVNPYGNMSDDEIDEHFRMGWIAFNKNEPFDLEMPVAWREGWIKSQKSAVSLVKAKHDIKETAPSGNNRI